MDDKITARALSMAEESFLAGSGPGGQNANKVATQVELRINIYRLGLSPEIFRRLKEIAGHRLASNGDLRIIARRHRTQEANRAEAREKLAELLKSAQTSPTKRAPSRLNRIGKTKRLKAKKARGQVKAGRGRISRSDW